MDNSPSSNPVKRNVVKEFFQLGPVFGYFFRGKDPNRHTNFNLKVMHGINKISILMFLMGVIFILIKKLF